jgi:hypothetical protein
MEVVIIGHMDVTFMEIKTKLSFKIFSDYLLNKKIISKVFCKSKVWRVGQGLDLVLLFQ